MDGPYLEAVSEEEGRADIRRRLDSREWWVIPWVSYPTMEMSIAIEEAHYLGKHEDDFDVCVVKLPPTDKLLPISFAKKSRMDADALIDVLQGIGGVNREITKATIEGGKDIVYAPYAEQVGDGAARDIPAMIAFRDWLHGDDGWVPR